MAEININRYVSPMGLIITYDHHLYRYFSPMGLKTLGYVLYLQENLLPV